MVGTLNPGWEKTLINKQWISQAELDRQEFRGEIFLKYANWFNEFMKKLERKRFVPTEMSYSFLKEKRPLNNPAWDDFAPRALNCFLNFLKPSLPMLTGKTEYI